MELSFPLASISLLSRDWRDGLIWSIWFVWFNPTNETDQINKKTSRVPRFAQRDLLQVQFHHLAVESSDHVGVRCQPDLRFFLPLVGQQI
mgnify:CR=1 FL=1